MNGSPLRWRHATFNIQYAALKHWVSKQDNLLNLLRGLHADFLCLQEVSGEGLAWLLDRLGQPPHAGVGREDGAGRGEHVPIIVLNPAWETTASGTFWFSTTPEVPSRSWGAAHPRICTWVHLRLRADPTTTLALYNLHLDHSSRRAREESVRLLRAHFAANPPPGPLLLCGDFNLRDHATAYALVGEIEPRLVDVGRAQSVTGPTWDGWGLFALGRARIDYVFTSRGIRVDAHAHHDNRVGRERISDHHPVVTEFSLGSDWGLTTEEGSEQ